MDRPLLVGAQASEPSSITIWRTVRDYFTAHGVPMDYALFSTYEALNQALLAGAIDIAWNAPMAQAQTLIQSGGACRALAMRDTDHEVSTVLLVRADSPVTSVQQLRGKRVALGSPLSSEQALIPKYQLRQDGLDLDADCEVVPLEPKEHPGGGRWVEPLAILAAIQDGLVDAGTLFEPYFSFLTERKRIDPAAFREIWRTRPFSHCGFAARPGLPEDAGQRFVEVLTSMDYQQQEIKEMMDLEHLRAWMPADESGWKDLIAAIEEEGLVGATY